jgi:hypothetical protein
LVGESHFQCGKGKDYECIDKETGTLAESKVLLGSYLGADGKCYCKLLEFNYIEKIAALEKRLDAAESLLTELKKFNDETFQFRLEWIEEPENLEEIDK